MKKFALFILFGLTLMIISGCSDTTSNPDNNSSDVYMFGDGYKLFNLVPVFLGYADKGAPKSESERLALWDSELEQKYPDFFNQVLYRNLQGSERTIHKNYIIAQFWNTIIPGKKDVLKQYNPTAVQKILDGRSLFKNKFNNFNPQCDYYLTIAFSFFGKAADLNGNTIFAIGLENFNPGEINLDFTIAHEQFHLYHFGKGFSASGGLYRGIWTESMATYSQLFIYPGNYTYSELLNFSGSRINDIVNSWESLKQNLESNLTNSDQTIKRTYLGEEYNNLGIPPACGYYFGLRIVLTLIEQGNSFIDMTNWTAEQVLLKIQEVLPSLKAN